MLAGLFVLFTRLIELSSARFNGRSNEPIVTVPTLSLSLSLIREIIRVITGARTLITSASLNARNVTKISRNLETLRESRNQFLLSLSLFLPAAIPVQGIVK